MGDGILLLSFNVTILNKDMIYLMIILPSENLSKTHWLLHGQCKKVTVLSKCKCSQWGENGKEKSALELDI